jgi:hypothetical protein
MTVSSAWSAGLGATGRRWVEGSRSRAAERVIWAVVGVTVTLLGESLLAMGVTTLLLGVRIYWWHGRQQITAAGLYSLATAVFVGFAAIWWAIDSPTQPQGLFRATWVGYWVLLGMSCFWKDDLYRPLVLTRDSQQSTAWAGIASFVLSMMLTLWIFPTRNESHAVLTQVILGCMGLLACSLILHRARENKSVRRLWLAGVVVAVFTQYVFSGYGRLNLVALGFVALVAASALSRRRLLKALTIVGVGPALVVFTLMRQRFVAGTYGVDSSSGPGSVVTPLRDFAALTRLGDAHFLPYGHGDSFFASAVFWVPRALWSDKPVGLGSELTRLLRPDLLSVDQSLAAFNQGEWFYDFGWLGVIAMVPVMGLLVRLLDSTLRRLVSQPLDSRRRLISLVIVFTLVSDMPNLMWVGSFGYTSRVLLRLVPLFALLAFATRTSRSRPSPALKDSAAPSATGSGAARQPP